MWCCTHSLLSPMKAYWEHWECASPPGPPAGTGGDSNPPHKAVNVRFPDASQWPGFVGGKILIRLLVSGWCDASSVGHYLVQTPRQLSSRSFEAAASQELSVLLITALLRSGTYQGLWCATRHIKRGGRVDMTRHGQAITLFQCPYTQRVQAEGTRLQLFDGAIDTLRKVYSHTKGCSLSLKKGPMLGAIW